jgi:hypothetical protein
MSKRPTHRKATSEPVRGNDQVGYSRPPKEHQFKPGRSGNPKGRPKGAKNEATILRNIFNRQIESREAGRVRKISVLEGMLLKFAEDALKGNPKSATFLHNRYRLAVGAAPESDENDQDDKQILDGFIERLQAELKAKKG